jgi:hypothetical protein
VVLGDPVFRQYLVVHDLRPQVFLSRVLRSCPCIVFLPHVLVSLFRTYAHRCSYLVFY